VTQRKDEVIVDFAEIAKKLDQAKQAKARLEGQRDRLEADLKSLGFDTLEAAQLELENVKKYISENEPILKKRVEDFLSAHSDALATIQSLR
jgi:septal ring factor EnvC (AmiA/AmiB activator)